MSCKYCLQIQDLAFVVNGRIDVPGAPVISVCCEMIKGMPRLPFVGTPEEILRNFIGMSTLLKTECNHISDDSKRCFTAGCIGCVNFLPKDSQPSLPNIEDNLIHHVNLSSYPAPCQSHCFYCWVHDWDERITLAARKGYEKMFQTLELADRCGIIAPDAKWQISSGEIAIHPYRDRIMALVKGKAAVFFTNCMKYDEGIAQNLHENPDSAINLSIDSGVHKTWAKVKGVDNFDKMIENLVKYHVASLHPEQITLKYIVFPGINDNYEDYFSLMEIIKVLKLKTIFLSRDGRTKYNAGSSEHTNLMESTAYLVAMCRKNEVVPDMLPFSKSEQEEINQLADEIIQRNLI